jgi:hypothetical protein
MKDKSKEISSKICGTVNEQRALAYILGKIIRKGVLVSKTTKLYNMNLKTKDG